MRLKQSDRKEVHDHAVVKLAKELLAPIEAKLGQLAEILWEHHCGEASRRVTEAGIDMRFYKTDDVFNPVTVFKGSKVPRGLSQAWGNNYSSSPGKSVNDVITKSGRTLRGLIELKCRLPERRPAPIHLYDLECETHEQKSLVQNIFSDLEKTLEKLKEFSRQVDELLTSAKTLDQLKELSPTLAAWVDVPEPKKHLPLPVETANKVNSTLAQLAAG